MKEHKVVILGLHFGHDAGVAVLIDGIPKCNLIRERYNRSKHSFGINVSHIEEALLDAKVKVEDIDMISITSTQGFELVVVDRPNDLEFKYGENPNNKYLNPNNNSFEKRLCGNIIECVYQKNKQHNSLKNSFPEYKSIKQEDLGITKSLLNFPSIDFWKDEICLKDIKHIKFNNILTAKEKNQNLFHYPMQITLKGRNIPGVSIQHQLAHAASTFYNCKSNESIILTHDGGIPPGPSSGMIFYGESNKIIPIVPNHLFLGTLYNQIGQFLGFDLFGGAGKLMGLAPYGKPVFFKKEMVGNTYDLRSKGFKEPTQDWIKHCIKLSKLKGYNLDPIGNTNKILEPICVDIAASTQKLFEETLLYTVNCISEMCFNNQISIDTLCYAGGTGLNCPANSLLLKDSSFRNIYIPPNCDDSGLSLGVAQYAYHHLLNKPRLKMTQKSYLSLPYLGLENSKNDLNKAIKKYENQINIEENIDCEQSAANDLHENKIIAWFEGRSEIGPRALGHRSLLSNPSYPENWPRMNELKQREKWRPFAPAVLKEDVNLYFKGLLNESPFMLFTAQVLKSNLPAITHVDGSARVQTVTEETGGLFLILKKLKEISGSSVVLNTSFNGPKEPIVEKPEEAIDFLVTTKLDVLYLNGKKITRK
ncbi:carbamoyltransferase C-terminal domain-containing protein [Prochlorococcus marinus]|uniref:carbamoyltransferase C-terminal domain-containing protein n=1 Tax=Prochlorococcus marinus TaxID=1219 RepID=UPI0022B4BA44|nr:carbamoyltransferase C-terminal domain-containing protein [Prochlorococcus marinus]